MINAQYKLTEPMRLETFYRDLSNKEDHVLVRPESLSICKADMRYYFGQRDAKTLKQRLPLALIHEAVGTVLHDPSHQFQTGETVVLLPNIPGKQELFGENYRLDSRFRSSRADGFMQEIIQLPHSEIVPYHEIPESVATITEFISVGVHAVKTYMKVRKKKAERIAVWGDGGLGYVISCIIKFYMPEVHLTNIGVSKEKLEIFQFADERKTIDEVEAVPMYDDVFECVGGQASGSAISQMIDTILPEGNMILMGVSEEPVPVNTRMVLEKGLTMIGRSRSTREDFCDTVRMMEENSDVVKRMKLLISEEVDIWDMGDIHRAFNASKAVDYKVVMKWKI